MNIFQSLNSYRLEKGNCNKTRRRNNPPKCVTSMPMYAKNSLKAYS